MLKKSILFAVVALMALTLSLTGCGNQPKAGNDQKGAAEQKVLKIASDTAYAPFEFQDENSKAYIGFDMDLVNAIAQKIGYKAEVQSMNFDGLIPALESGNIDLAISAMSITPERSQKILFSDPYYKSGLTVVVRKDDTEIKGFDELKGKKIAVQIGTTGAEEAKKVPGATVREFNTAPEAFMELKAKGVDAVVNDMPVNEYFINQAGGKDAKTVGAILHAENYGIATAKKNTELMNKVNQALAELKQNGEYEKIYVKWFGKKPEA